jgi:hypothetical protein
MPQSTYPGTGVFEPVQSDTALLVDDDGNRCNARDIWFKADGTVAFVCVDGSTGSWTGTAGTGLPKPLEIRQILDTGTDLSDANMLCIK